MVMVHKFMERAEELPPSLKEALGDYRKPPSAGNFGVVNDSPRILLMIDEAHRTQSSDLGDNLFEAFPNATRIAFTGTPLITEQHGTKRTVKRFGEYIDCNGSRSFPPRFSLCFPASWSSYWRAMWRRSVSAEQ